LRPDRQRLPRGRARHGARATPAVQARSVLLALSGFIIATSCAASAPPRAAAPTIAPPSAQAPVAAAAVTDTGAAHTPPAQEFPRGPRLPPHVPVPNARIYLTWNAPFGQARASSDLMAPCGDSATRDTLYMCFDPGREAEHLLGMTATVYFWAGAGDTLPPQWHFGEGEGFRGLQVQFSPDSVPGAPPAWPSPAVARSFFTNTSASGKLKMILAVGLNGAPSASAGHLYCFARLLVPRGAEKTPECDRPICIEWAVGSIAFDFGDAPDINRGSRFVSWNSPDGKVCAPLRKFAEPWQPPRPVRPGTKSK
jgi:hypothetical protein